MVCLKAGELKHFIIANVYAPNANNNEKISFFEEVFDAISEFETMFDTSHTLLVGDFNLIFNGNEAKNRIYSS